MRWLFVVVVAVGCGFAPRPAQLGDDGGLGIDAPVVAGLDPPWWDPGWSSRHRLAITTGAVRPDKGYAGYTVVVGAFDPATLRAATLDCSDLRVVVWSGSAWSELPRHLIGCGSTLAQIRFALPIDLADSTTWRGAFIYGGNPNPPAAPAVTLTNVYRWWDPATSDRTSQYTHGRMDAWLGTGYADSLAWNAGGYYTYDTGNDSQAGYRIAVDERDVLVEASWFHTGCYTNNMQSSVCARGIITSGTNGSELSDHYYCTSRAQNPTCNNTDQGIYDGDIVKTDNEIIAIYAGADPPPIVASQWRKQALGVFGVAPTQLRFWDADVAWAGLATPPPATLIATGTDTPDYEGRGFAGIMSAQDIGRVRDVVIRRYVEPEPTSMFETEEVRP